MKILHIDTESGFRGGQRQVQLLLRGLRARGHESVLVAPENSRLLSTMGQEGIECHGYKKPMLLGMRSPCLHRWLRGVAGICHPDVFHAHSGNAHTMALGALSRQVPLVISRRVDFPIKGNLFSRQKYRANGQHFIAISKGVREVLIAGGVEEECISVVFSGVNVARVRGGDGAALRQEWLGDSAGPLIGFVGALVDHKAPWVLAEAAAFIRRELAGARVVFVGDGEERGRLEEFQRQAPEALRLVGWREDVADCYAAFDLFAMPSKLEGLCTALVDALAAGVPAVASAVGGIPDVVVDGETGVLVPAGDAVALAEAVVELWRDESRRGRLAQNGRLRVEKQFTADAMVDGTVGVYEQVLRAL